MEKVTDKKYWEWRVNEAFGQNKPYWSVYLTGDRDWNHIETEHKKIIEKEGVEGRILDAGCGYGRLSEWFTDYTGVDFSPDFLERAQTMYPDKNFLEADLKDLPFEDNTFDWAICVSIKQMIIGKVSQDAWEHMERELLRVARRLLILEYTNPHEYWVSS